MSAATKDETGTWQSDTVVLTGGGAMAVQSDLLRLSTEVSTCLIQSCQTRKLPSPSSFSTSSSQASAEEDCLPVSHVAAISAPDSALVQPVQRPHPDAERKSRVRRDGNQDRKRRVVTATGVMSQSANELNMSEKDLISKSRTGKAMLKAAENRGRKVALKELAQQVSNGVLKGMIAVEGKATASRVGRCLQHKAPTQAQREQGQRAKRTFKGSGREVQKSLNVESAYSEMKAEDAADTQYTVYKDEQGRETSQHKFWGPVLESGLTGLYDKLAQEGRLHLQNCPVTTDGVSEMVLRAATWEDDGVKLNPMRVHRLWAVGIDESEEVILEGVTTAELENATACEVHTVNKGKPKGQLLRDLHAGVICERIAAYVCPLIYKHVRIRVLTTESINDELGQQERGNITGGNSHCRCMYCTGVLSNTGLNTEGDTRCLNFTLEDGTVQHMGPLAFNMVHLHKTLLKGKDWQNILTKDKVKANNMLGKWRNETENFAYGIRGTPQDYLVRITLVDRFEDTSIFKGNFHNGRAYTPPPRPTHKSYFAESLAGVKIPTPLPHEEDDVIELFLTKDMAEDWMSVIRDQTHCDPGILHFGKGAIIESIECLQEKCLDKVGGLSKKADRDKAFNELVNDITGREDRNNLKAKDFTHIAFALPTRVPTREGALPLNQLCSPKMVMAMTLLRDVIVSVQNPLRCYTEQDWKLEFFPDLSHEERVGYFTIHAAWNLLVLSLLLMSMLPMSVKLHFHIMALHYAIEMLLAGKAGIQEQLAEGAFLYYNQNLVNTTRVGKRMQHKRMYERHSKAYTEQTNKYKTPSSQRRHPELRKDQAMTVFQPPLAILPATLLEFPDLGTKLKERIERLTKEAPRFHARVCVMSVDDKEFHALLPNSNTPQGIAAVQSTVAAAQATARGHDLSVDNPNSVEQRQSFLWWLSANMAELYTDKKRTKDRNKANNNTAKKSKSQ
jgi:hypothetical protein